MSHKNEVEMKLIMIRLWEMKYLSPNGGGVILLAAEGHQHGVVVGSVRLEDVVRVLAVHQSNGCVDVLLGHVLERWCVRIIKSFLKRFKTRVKGLIT